MEHGATGGSLRCALGSVSEQHRQPISALCQSCRRFTEERDQHACRLAYAACPWRLRVKPSLQLSFVGAPSITLTLHVPERPDVYVTVKEAIGASVQHQELRVTVGEAWTEVLFDLRGPRDERLQVAIYHPRVSSRSNPVS